MTEPIDEILELAGRFDDASLEHLANKGLVRRGKKLINDSVVIAATDSGCTVTGDGWRVEFDAERALQDGVCDCSTAGACQHLIASIMQLRTASPEAQPEADSAESVGASDIQEALLGMSDDELLAWAKTTDSRWAAGRIESLHIDDVVIETTSYLRVDLPPPHASVQFMSPELSQAIVKPSGRNDRRAIALAILAVWARANRRFTPPASSSSAPMNELVEERSGVLLRVERLASDLLVTGLLHIGDPEAERMGSLAASLRGVKLYRLSLLAERIADQIDALADLSPAADTEFVLERLAELVAVAEATTDRFERGIALPEGLAGVARAAYESVGVLNLVGLGSYDWGDHRFAGSTLVAAETASKIYSVSAPTKANGRMIGNPPRWTGVSSPAALAGHRFQLADAQASNTLRLSSSGKSASTLVGEITTAELDSLAWDGASPSRGSKLLGFPSTVWAVLRVDQQNAPLSFDPIEQALVWSITSAGTDVVVRLPYSTHSKVALETLEDAASRKPEFVCGRLRATTSGLVLWPISVMVKDKFINLSSPPKKRRTSGLVNLLASLTTETDEPIELIEQPGPLERIAGELVRFAEGGRRATTSDALTELSASADNIGFGVIAKTIDRSPSPQLAILRASWLVQLSKEIDE